MANHFSCESSLSSALVKARMVWVLSSSGGGRLGSRAERGIGGTVRIASCAGTAAGGSDAALTVAAAGFCAACDAVAAGDRFVVGCTSTGSWLGGAAASSVSEIAGMSTPLPTWNGSERVVTTGSWLDAAGSLASVSSMTRAAFVDAVPDCDSTEICFAGEARAVVAAALAGVASVVLDAGAMLEAALCAPVIADVDVAAGAVVAVAGPAAFDA